jgi:Flp pilus assembly protein TadB
MQKLIFLFSLLIVLVAVYQLLPAIACRCDRRLDAARLNQPGLDLLDGPKTRRWRALPPAWRSRLLDWLRQAGYHSESALTAYIAILFAPIPVYILAGSLFGLSGSHILWLALISAFLVNSRIGNQIKVRRRLFTRSLYKLYRFLDLQISAGIKVTDAVRGLPEATGDPQIKPCLIRFAARFELTLNLDQAMDEIRRNFPGTDCELLATHLRQCLQTGAAGRSLVRMEELLFSRYFTLMQQDTKHIRTELLFVAILGMCPAIIFFLYPLLFEAIQAIQSVFGSI